MSRYDDIIRLSRPESSHPRMRREERAKLFAPFAALSGHDEAAHQRDKVLVPKIAMTEHSQEGMDRKLQALHKGDQVTVTWFVPRKRKDGECLGEYCTVTDRVVRLDPFDRMLYLESEIIPFDDLADIRK